MPGSQDCDIVGTCIAEDSDSAGSGAEEDQPISFGDGAGTVEMGDETVFGFGCCGVEVCVDPCMARLSPRALALFFCVSGGWGKLSAWPDFRSLRLVSMY